MSNIYMKYSEAGQKYNKIMKSQNSKSFHAGAVDKLYTCMNLQRVFQGRAVGICINDTQ